MNQTPIHMPLSPPPTVRWKDRRLMTGALVAAAVIFIVDLQLPLGVGITTLYGIVVLIGIFVRNPRFPLWVSGLATVLTVVGALLSPPGGSLMLGMVNRVLTLVGIWVTAWLVTSYGTVGR